MNLREGTRRLALLLGLAGAIVGGFASYLESQDVRSQRTRHDNFQRLSALDLVQQLRSDHQKNTNSSEASVKTVMPGCCGIKEVVWDSEHIWNDGSGIYSIETDDGRTLYPTPAPTVWSYLLIGLFPILGFFIPWTTIRAIGWVGAGFVQSAKQT